MAPRKEVDPDAWPEVQFFVERLTGARHAAGLSQRQLAEVTGLDASYIALLERRRANPSLQVMIVLSRAVGVPLGQMLPGRVEGGVKTAAAKGTEVHNNDRENEQSH